MYYFKEKNVQNTLVLAIQLLIWCYTKKEEQFHNLSKKTQQIARLRHCRDMKNIKKKNSMGAKSKNPIFN
jgi:hypothetical protein